MKRILCVAVLLAALATSSQAQRKTQIVESAKPTQVPEGKTIKRKVAIGRFSNETQYAKGVFYDKENDPMGKQALDILSAKLAASGKFLLLERSDLAQLLEEAKKSENGESGLQSIGADYLIIGSITEFGRKNTGKEGVFTSTKMQTVEAGVAIRLVDVSTGLIVYSDEAKGHGGRADFDATLSDKAISEAIGQLVENIINKCTDKPWRTFFLTYDADAQMIAGGASQGVKEGDTFAVKTRGKKVKNPQSGMMIELPGNTGGDTPETEYSFVEYNGTTPIDASKLNTYYIEEIKK